MNEPLNTPTTNNDFFYIKDKGPNENVENEMNHLINKSKKNVKMCYILQFTEIACIILCIIFNPYDFSTRTSVGAIITLSLLFGLFITIIIITYIFMMFRISETHEFILLSSKRECKGIIEVLQDYFYKTPFEVFRISEDISNYKSWIDISGKLTLNMSSAEKSYVILFIRPNIQKYDKDGKLGNIIYSYDSTYAYSNLIHYVKIGNEVPSFFNANYFYFFYCIGLGGLYLFYIRCYIKHAEFIVKKIINEKDDFNTMKQNMGYDDKFTPGISINGKEYMYDRNLAGGNIEVVEKKVPDINMAQVELKYKIQVNA